MKNACSSAVRALRRSGHLTWRQNRFAGGFGGTITPSTFSTLKNKGNSPWHPGKYWWRRAVDRPPSSTSRWPALFLRHASSEMSSWSMAPITGYPASSTKNSLTLPRKPATTLKWSLRTPSSALGSTRDKPDLKYCQEIFKVLKAHGIGYFFYIGGNDSSDTVRIVSEEARRGPAIPLRCIHIPKTIDNDLVGNDHTPGYPSAARFVAQAFMGANLDNASLPGVYLGGSHGPACRIPDSRRGIWKEIPGRWPAFDLSSGKSLQRRKVPDRRQGDLRQVRPLRYCGLGRYSR
jgi:hypothetical protein